MYMYNLRPNKERATNAVRLLQVMIAVEAIALISTGFEYSLLQTMANGGEYTIEQAEANDLRQMIIGLLLVGTYIVCAVVFIQWFRRAYYNLHIVFSDLSNGEGWAAGAWFVPIANLYMPYQIMKELYKKTDLALRHNSEGYQSTMNIAIVGWWWGLWVTNNLFANVSTRLSLNAETIDELISSSMLDMIGSVISIASALLAIRVIKGYTEIEDLLHNLEKDEPNNDEETQVASPLLA